MNGLTLRAPMHANINALIAENFTKWPTTKAAMLHTIGVKFGLIIAEVRVAHDAQRNWAFK